MPDVDPIFRSSGEQRPAPIDTTPPTWKQFFREIRRRVITPHIRQVNADNPAFAHLFPKDADQAMLALPSIYNDPERAFRFEQLFS